LILARNRARRLLHPRQHHVDIAPAKVAIEREQRALLFLRKRVGKTIAQIQRKTQARGGRNFGMLRGGRDQLYCGMFDCVLNRAQPVRKALTRNKGPSCISANARPRLSSWVSPGQNRDSTLKHLDNRLNSSRPEDSSCSCYSCGMVRREIEIDEDTNRLLTELASEYKGDLSLALADLVHAREGLEDFAERSEAAHENALRAQRDRSAADFPEGRTVVWEDVKARNGL
jgi:hypothetical protein